MAAIFVQTSGYGDKTSETVELEPVHDAGVHEWRRVVAQLKGNPLLTAGLFASSVFIQIREVSIKVRTGRHSREWVAEVSGWSADDPPVPTT